MPISGVDFVDIQPIIGVKCNISTLNQVHIYIIELIFVPFEHVEAEWRIYASIN